MIFFYYIIILVYVNDFNRKSKSIFFNFLFLLVPMRAIKIEV